MVTDTESGGWKWVENDLPRMIQEVIRSKFLRRRRAAPTFPAAPL